MNIKTTLVLLLVLNLSWSVFLHFEPTHTTFLNYLYNLGYGLNYLLAAWVSFSYFKTCTLHRAIHITGGLGALSFFLAQLIWMYYNLVLRAEVPYPSPADLFWTLFYFFISAASLLVMRAIHIRLTWGVILQTTLTFSAIFFITYSFILSSSPQEGLPLLIRVLNLSYPFFDSLLIAFTLTAIRSQMGHLQPLLLYFVFSFIALAFSDSLFAYQTTLETYWNGNVVDAIYAISGFLFAMGTASIHDLLHAPQPARTVLAGSVPPSSAQPLQK